MPPSTQNERLCRAVEQVVQYLADERRDFQAAIDDGYMPVQHIYFALQTLESWLQWQQVERSASADRSIPAAASELPACGCGGEMHEIDADGRSTSARCESCRQYFLVVDDGHGDPAVIHLRNFEARREDGPRRYAVGDHSKADQLATALASGGWPSPATIVNYGIDTPAHFEALREAARAGVTPYEFDRVLGDGKAIEELVRATTSDPALHIPFRTAFDHLYELGQQLPDRAQAADATIDQHAGEQQRTRQFDDPDIGLDR